MMTKQEAELIIKEQDKSTKEILKAIEKEKCELLGIIQGKDTVIYELEKENEELKAQVEKMTCCENCAFFKEKTYAICHKIKKLGTRKCAFYKMI